MTPELKALLAEAHRRRHVFRYSRTGSEPATEEALRAFELAFGTIPADYRWYLSECGGGYVGSESLNGIKELTDSHTRFREQRAEGLWEEADGVFVTGGDGGGNWMGIHVKSGRFVVICDDGGVETKAASFEEFLVGGLLEHGKLPDPIPETKYGPRIGLDDCEAGGRKHEWYNADGRHSGCYHCATIRVGQLWKKK